MSLCYDMPLFRPPSEGDNLIIQATPGCSVADEFHRKYGEPFAMPNDLEILKEQERLVLNLNPPQPVIFRSNHASNQISGTIETQ